MEQAVEQENGRERQRNSRIRMAMRDSFGFGSVGRSVSIGTRQSKIFRHILYTSPTTRDLLRNDLPALQARVRSHEDSQCRPESRNIVIARFARTLCDLLVPRRIRRSLLHSFGSTRYEVLVQQFVLARADGVSQRRARDGVYRASGKAVRVCG